MLQVGTDDDVVPKDGGTVSIHYKGTIEELEWSTEEVIACWLSTLQGLDDLAPAFRKHAVDSHKVMDLNEDFVMKELGVDNKIRAKKLVMAAKRLKSNVLPTGTVFDARLDEPYSFVVGQGTVIKGMDTAVRSMVVGESSKFTIRSDHAYGADGVRRSNGDVIVPPYSTLGFEITLLSFE